MAIASDIVLAISERLAERAGLELPAWVVEARAAARMEALALTPDHYVELIASGRGAAELDELVEAVRVGETRLFRHRAQIAALCDDIAPALRAAGKRLVRVWSAGCAGGEEAYTLAVVLARALPGIQLQIIATDVSADALALAQAGQYRATALADVPEVWRDDFVVDGDRMHVRRELADLVRFERANLVDGNAPKSCDIVWCRNVLIYFTPEARRRAIERLVAATHVGGYLFVGYSESLRDVPSLDAVRAGEAVYYVKRAAAAGAAASATPAPRLTPAIGIPRTFANAAAAAAANVTAAGVAAVNVPSTGAASAAAAGVAAAAAAAGVAAVNVPVTGAGASAAARVAAGDSGLWRVTQHTPPPTRIPLAPPTEDTLVLRGEPAARTVTAELTARLGIAGLRKLVVDLDAADMLSDELVPVFRRARAAADTAHVVLELRATRPGTKRWLARHGLAAAAEESP